MATAIATATNEGVRKGSRRSKRRYRARGTLRKAKAKCKTRNAKGKRQEAEGRRQKVVVHDITKHLLFNLQSAVRFEQLIQFGPSVHLLNVLGRGVCMWTKK